MKKQTDFAIPFAVITAIMIMALGYFWLYRSSTSLFNVRTPLKLDEVSYDDMALLDINNLPGNISISQNLLLVNKDHPLPDDYEASITFYKDTDVPMNTAITSNYANLSAAVLKKFNNRLYVESSYRSHEHQAEVYEEEGPEIAALPGTSEHETGLALDVYVMYYGGASFIKSEEGRFVNSHCQDYGFIIRYPKGEDDITGFAYEPWHIRYVGFPHSTLIANSGITLEEYIDFFKIGSYYSYDNYLVARMPSDEIRIPSEYLTSTIVLSPDNCGFTIVTITK